MSILQRLELLRTEMRRANVDIYLVPSIDAHNSEYVPECWQRRPWISGFDGSAGEVMVTLDQAYLWTDGRYFLQAEQQLNPACFQLMVTAACQRDAPWDRSSISWNWSRTKITANYARSWWRSRNNCAKFN